MDYPPIIIIISQPSETTLSINHLMHSLLSYNDSTFEYIHIENSDSTFGYIQFSPISTFVVFVGMNIKENEKYMYTVYDMI